MSPRASLNPDDFPDSPFARELSGGISRLRFAPVLEADYLSVHLRRARMRIRIWCLMSFVIALGFAFQRTSHERLLTADSATLAACIASIWAILAAIAFSGRYEKLYPPVGQGAVMMVSALNGWFNAHSVAGAKKKILCCWQLSCSLCSSSWGS